MLRTVCVTVEITAVEVCAPRIEGWTFLCSLVFEALAFMDNLRTQEWQHLEMGSSMAFVQFRILDSD